MSQLPERFDLPRGQKVGTTVLAGVMLAAAAVAAWFAWHGIAGATDPRGQFVGLSSIAAFLGVFGGVIAFAARQGWRSAITLRDGGVDLERGEDTPTFIGWGQVGGLKLQSAAGGTAVLGLDGEKLFTVDNRLVGVGRLLHAILMNGVLPKRSPALPYHAEQSVPRIVPVALVVALGVGGIVAAVNTPAVARPGVLVSFAVIAAIVAGVLALASRLASGGAITVDADGITYGRAGTRRPWSAVQGAALAFVRGPKGQLFPRVALQGSDGRWEPLLLQGADLVELLAAINAAAPGKVIDPPDQPLGMAGRINVTFKVNKTFRIGPRPPGTDDPT